MFKTFLSDFSWSDDHTGLFAATSQTSSTMFELLWRNQQAACCQASSSSLYFIVAPLSSPCSPPPFSPPYSSSCSKNSWQQTVTMEMNVMNSWKLHSASPSVSRLSIRLSRVAWSFTCCRRVQIRSHTTQRNRSDVFEWNSFQSNPEIWGNFKHLLVWFKLRHFCVASAEISFTLQLASQELKITPSKSSNSLF